MKIYYLQSEYEPGKHKIIHVNYDRDDYAWHNTINVSYGVMTVDELAPDNKDICRDVMRTYAAQDSDGESKYHIEIENTEPVLYEKDGWEEFLEE